MNQAILFSDDAKWNGELRQIAFSAHHMGGLIECIVPEAVLSRISGCGITDEHSALDQFAQLRFDLEELAEVLIEDDSVNDLGQVVLN
jgi:hypothetical protein